MQSSSILSAPSLEILRSHLEQFNEPYPVHDEQHNEEPDQGDLRVTILPLHVAIRDQTVYGNINNSSRENHQHKY